MPASGTSRRPSVPDWADDSPELASSAARTPVPAVLTNKRQTRQREMRRLTFGLLLFCCYILAVRSRLRRFGQTKPSMTVKNKFRFIIQQTCGGIHLFFNKLGIGLLAARVSAYLRVPQPYCVRIRMPVRSWAPCCYFSFPFFQGYVIMATIQQILSIKRKIGFHKANFKKFDRKRSMKFIRHALG